MSTAQNYFTGTEYQGKNAGFLNLEARAKKYTENQWATYKQWKENGYQVQKGEKGTPIQVVKENEENEKFIRYYRVFNLAQVKEIEEEK